MTDKMAHQRQLYVKKIITFVRHGDKPRKTFVTLSALIGNRSVKTTKDNGRLIANKRKIVFTSSTCSVVNEPPYFDLPRSTLEGISSSQYVRALRLTGALYLAANLRTW